VIPSLSSGYAAAFGVGRISEAHPPFLLLRPMADAPAAYPPYDTPHTAVHIQRIERSDRGGNSAAGHDRLL